MTKDYEAFVRAIAARPIYGDPITIADVTDNIDIDDEGRCTYSDEDACNMLEGIIEDARKLVS